MMPCLAVRKQVQVEKYALRQSGWRELRDQLCGDV